MLEYVGATLSWLLERFRVRWRCILAFSLAFRALNLVLLAPLAAATLRLCLLRWGRASVGNFEIASFFLSPVGLAAMLGVGTIGLATLYLELSGLIRLLADDRLHWWESFKSSSGMFHRLIHLGVRQLVVYLAWAVPFLVAIGVIYWLLWSGKDLNGLIILKPPAFWWGATLAGVIAAAYIVLALQIFLRRSLYAVPILVFEPGLSVSQALRKGIERSRGTIWRSARAIAIWAAILCVLTAAVLGLLQIVLQAMLSLAGSSLATVLLFAAAALIINTLVATILCAF